MSKMLPKKRTLFDASDEEFESDNDPFNQTCKKIKKHSTVSTNTIKSPSPTPTASTKTPMKTSPKSTKKQPVNANTYIANLIATNQTAQNSLEAKILSQDEKISEMKAKQNLLKEEAKEQKLKIEILVRLQAALVDEEKAIASVDELVAEVEEACLNAGAFVLHELVDEMRSELMRREVIGSRW